MNPSSPWCSSSSLLESTSALGHAWMTDYGNPDQSKDFQWLLPLSPLHNVARPADGGQYPAFLLTTGDHDDRVVPLHTLKLIATLQYTLAAQGEYLWCGGNWCWPGTERPFWVKCVHCYLSKLRTKIPHIWRSLVAKQSAPSNATDPSSSSQRNPLITRVEVRAGHGAGKPTAKVIAEIADMYGFAATAIGAKWARET